VRSCPNFVSVMLSLCARILCFLPLTCTIGYGALMYQSRIRGSTCTQRHIARKTQYYKIFLIILTLSCKPSNFRKRVRKVINKARWKGDHRKGSEMKWSEVKWSEEKWSEVEVRCREVNCGWMKGGPHDITYFINVTVYCIACLFLLIIIYIIVVVKFI
jgi:hypothetical protein